METMTATSSPVLLHRTLLDVAGPIFLMSTEPRCIVRPELRLKHNTFAKSSRSLRSTTRVCMGRRSFVVRASASVDSSDSSVPIAPLQLESPVGQFLTQILMSHPHLVPAAVEQQLEQFQADREAEAQKNDTSSVLGTDIVLSRRIAEVKKNERRKALEEILYTLVVQKFVDAKVSLVPSIMPSSGPYGRVDTTWPPQEEKIEQLHSPEAYEMIQNHLALILGDHLGGDPSSVAHISKLRVGQVYTSSVMYGYLLKRVDQRFQLEKTMMILSGGPNHGDTGIDPFASGIERDNFADAAYKVGYFAGGIGSCSLGSGLNPSRLRTYVMSFDAETLRRYGSIRSREAVGIIENHTEVLFGRPEMMRESSGDEEIKISFGGLKRLVLEAVTFGSFLWDVESYVDSRYHFVFN